MVKAIDTNLDAILEGSKQYRVPLYQRRYGWAEEQWGQLWSDIVELAELRRSDPTATHFIGSLVLAESPSFGPVGVRPFLVVDGQQRLTTLTLLLAAIRDHRAEAETPDHRERLDAKYLVNRYDEGQPAKLLPTQADRDSYLAVIRASPRAGQDDQVGGAYRYFRKQLAETDDPDDPHDIADIESAALRGLALVSVTAEAGDNEHRIFESLNNTGLRLTQSDLLKNYLFMRLGDRSDEVYRDVWMPLESSLGTSNLELLFWLDLAQRDERARQSDTYTGQQRRLSTLANSETVEAEILRIAGLGEILATILDPAREPDGRIRHRLERIRDWGTTTSYPLVMHILERRASGRSTTDQTVDALAILESYFVRRIVIGRATANLNRTLLQAVAAISDHDQAEVALRDYLSTGRKHYGSDQQIRDAVRSVAFYWQGRQPQKKLILRWLEESYGSKEVVDPSALTIEHVLPQTLTPEWRASFAEDLADDADLEYEHDRIVHTLGNLTLTGYNSELSNRPFGAKRLELQRSALRMNQEISVHEHWGMPEIEARSDALAERIIELWPGPSEGNDDNDESSGSALRVAVRAAVSAIPSGRWTSYGELAIIVNSHPVPLAAQLARYPMPNAWRVLRSGGFVASGFRWIEEDRDDDPREILEAEGVRFDADGRADAAAFLDAHALAALVGLDVGEDSPTTRAI